MLRIRAGVHVLESRVFLGRSSVCDREVGRESARSSFSLSDSGSTSKIVARLNKIIVLSRNVVKHKEIGSFSFLGFGARPDRPQ